MLVLLTPVAIAGVGARFSSVTANPPASFTAAKAWTCADAVLQRNAQADQYYPLQETAGPTATNIGALGSGASATYSAAGVRHAAPGPNCGGPTRSAVALDGVTGSIWTDRAVTDPDKFTLQVWFSTTTTTGGLLVGLGDGVDGAASTQYDRQVYMTPAGKVVFGLYDKGGVVHAVTSPASYNDGRWHLVTASYFFGPGMRLMVDGVEIGRDASIGSTTAYTGRWRAGYDAINPSWPGAPASGWFAGSLAHLAVFPFPMVQADAAVQYGVGPWTCAQAAGSGGANATRYWPLQESSGPTATNSGSAGALGNGTYAGTGVGLSVAGPPCGPGSGAAVQLDGQAGTVWTAQAVKAQPQFSEQIWFSTTTTSGGPLISFGAGPNGALSSQSDRNLYMSADGRLVAGVNGAAPSTVISPTPYNDGRWHLATVTFSPVTGLRLYVDGALVREDVVITAVPTPSWYWRIGSGDLSAWPSPPGSSYFAGSVAHASVYDNVLSDAEVSSAAAAGSG